MATRIDFIKQEGTRYRSVLQRPDGVTIAFEGGSYNKVGGRHGAVPHDLAHLVVEDELGLANGVWGVLLAGGLFRHVSVVGGRQAPHAARRGAEVVAAARESVMQAEILTRAVCDVSRGALPPDPAALRRAVGARWWLERLTEEAIERCDRRLREGAADWAALAVGGILTGWRPR